MHFVYDRLRSSSSRVIIIHILTVLFFCLFQSLLEDPHPVVRSTGILGVTQITSKYWEMIPPTILADLLKKITGELACDITSADVRCSVFKVSGFYHDCHFSILLDVQVASTGHLKSKKLLVLQNVLGNTIPNTWRFCTFHKSHMFGKPKCLFKQ